MRYSSLSDIRNLVYKKIFKLAPQITIFDHTNLENDLALDSLDITALLIDIEEELDVDLNSIHLDPILYVSDVITSFYMAAKKQNHTQLAK